MAKRNLDMADIEIVNPIVEIIKKYDNFEKEEMAKYEEFVRLRKEKKENEKLKVKNENHAYKLGKVFMVDAVLFIGVSAFKMKALYEIVDLKMELKDLNSKIFESEKIVDNLKYVDKSDKSDVSLSKVERESKKLGFTEDKNIEYIKFK